ncbi:MAG TPA: glycosyltransferase family A protein [Rhizomicrobium sp.]|jgi:glycosyltransferase involved in cell wall biosynthesis
MYKSRRPRVSAIIPTYNRAAFLKEALEAILSQTEPPDEVIVVDDGSTDDTQTVVTQSFSEVRYLRITNSGAPVARNAGAAQASGSWLWFCDSDDLWRPEYLARVRALIGAEPTPRFVFGNFRLVHDGVWDGRTKFQDAPDGFWHDLHVVRPHGDWLFSHSLYERLLTFQPIFHSTLVVERCLFETIGGYDSRFARTGSEDFEFVLRCASHGPAGVIRDALVGIRRHYGNASAGQLNNLLGEIEILRHASLHHHAAHAILPAIECQIALRSRQALELAFTAGDYARVRSLSATTKDNWTTGIKPRVKMLLAALPPRLRSPAISLLTRSAR